MLSPNDNTHWAAAKMLRGPRIHVPPIRKPNSKWGWSDKEKADIFARHLDAEPRDSDNERMSPPIRVFTPVEV